MGAGRFVPPVCFLFFSGGAVGGVCVTLPEGPLVPKEVLRPLFTPQRLSCSVAPIFLFFWWLPH